MKKILTGILGIILVVSVVSASAYALFSSQVTVHGVSFATGNADLQLGGRAGDITDPPTFQFNNLYPGQELDATVLVENTSSSDIDLKLNVRITSADGDWDALKNVIQVRITGNGDNTGWHTLATLNQAGGINLNSVLVKGTPVDYTVEVRVPSSATNVIADKALSNVTVVFTGTQAN